MKKLQNSLAPILCVIFFSAILIINASAQAREIKLATLNWAPFYGEDLPENGFFTALVMAAMNAAELKATVSFVPWKRALMQTERGDYDGVMGAYFSEERSKIYEYSDPIYTVSVVIFARKDIGLTRYNNLRELSEYTIATGRGFVYNPEFDAATYLKKKPATDQIINIRKLFRGRVELFAVNETVFRYEVNHHTNFDLKDVVKLTPPLAENDFFVMFPKILPDSKELAQSFNRGLHIIRNNGQADQILDRFGMSSK